MSIMIKGIKFPDVGVRNVVITFDGDSLCVRIPPSKEPFFSGRIVHMPTPRGRLIDADELIERIERFRDIHNYYPADIDATMRWFINQICGAKTIIEAEVSE